MKALTHFETSLISGGEVLYDAQTGTITLNENPEHLTINGVNFSLFFVRDNDGALSLSGIINGVSVLFSPEFDHSLGKPANERSP